MHVCNWCTPGPYAALAKANRELSLTNHPGLDFNTIEVPSKGRWVANTCQKPDVALSAIRNIPAGEGVLLIDADAYIQGKPDWTSLKSAFFGYVLWKRPTNGALVCLSGTLWLTNTNQCIDFVEGWKARCDTDPGIWDQAHLWKCVQAHVAGATNPDIYVMSGEWAWMEGQSIEPKHTAFVVHSQASRELKEQVDATKDICIEMQSTIDSNITPDNARETWGLLGDKGDQKTEETVSEAVSETVPEQKKRGGRPRKSQA